MSNEQAEIDSLDYSLRTNFNNRLYRLKRIQERLLNTITEDKTVLEIGAGEGLCTEWLADRFFRVTAIEPAKKFLACARAKVKASNVTFVPGLFEEFESDKKFDFIISANVLEHAYDAKAFLAHVLKFMKKHSKFLLTVPNARSLHRRIGRSMGLIKNFYELGEQDYRVGHHRYYDFASLQKELEMAGFIVNHISGVLLKPFPYSKMEQLSKEFCAALYEIGQELPDYCGEVFAEVERGTNA